MKHKALSAALKAAASQHPELAELLSEAAQAFDEISSTKISTNGDVQVVVSKGIFWNPNMEECPLGSKVQLLSVGRVPTYGSYSGPNDPQHGFWLAWAGLPKWPNSVRRNT